MSSTKEITPEQEERVCRLCEQYLAHIGKMGGINRFSLKTILREAVLYGLSQPAAIGEEERNKGRETIHISVVQYGVIWACEFTIGVQTFTVCERDRKEVADAYAKNLRTAFNNAKLASQPAAVLSEQEIREEAERLEKKLEEMNGSITSMRVQTIEEALLRVASLTAQPKQQEEQYCCPNGHLMEKDGSGYWCNRCSYGHADPKQQGEEVTNEQLQKVIDDVIMEWLTLTTSDSKTLAPLIVKAIRTHPTGEQQRWISVEERLPEAGQKVDLWLVSDDGKKGVRLPWTWEKQDTKNTRITGCKVSHWMPQPLPPTAPGSQETDKR